MKKFVSICIVMMCALLLAGCGENKPSDADQMNINGALVIGATTPYTGELTNTKIHPPQQIAGVEFMTYDAGGGIRYSPKSNVGYEKYKEIVAKMVELYGKPSRQNGDIYQWVTSDGTFKVTIAYNTKIFNSMAIGVN